MTYKIKINYDTGDSFKSEPNQEHVLELSWGSLDNAKANLKRIEQHYKLYQDLNSYFNRKTDKDIKGQYSREDWYVSQNTNLIKLYSDDGRAFQMWPVWIGYFEKLNFAEIITEDNDMKISFN